MMTSKKDDVIRQLFEDLCYLSHRHETQYWLDATGTPEERLQNILTLARQGLAVVTGKLRPEDAGDEHARIVAMRDLVASGGIVDAP